MYQNNSRKFAGSIRQALLISGIGLSVLAIAHGDTGSASVSSAAQCDARYTPAYSGDPDLDLGGFTLPLDGERFEKLEKSLAKRFSCATYKANAPIEDRFDVQSTSNGDVYAAVFDGHGMWVLLLLRVVTLVFADDHNIILANQAGGKCPST